ncbi:hypothetical protein [Myroides odoratimimus]|uniref:hypothetical protein n=1 Tax=Myroides odoratimimus TaxID=76832 RepID=UPI002578B33C|nr:hypothetical protein [Myroides odoratimimus]MDM1093421.1 hypothetical protein [Myroides odoratimimus]
MTREDLEDKAQEMMHIHNLEEIHVTTDGQGFTDKERAVSHSNLQKDKAVYHYHRKAKEVTVKTDTKVVDTERAELSEQYEKLFDKKPAYNMGLEKMRTAIKEKEAEVANTKVTTEAPVQEGNSDSEESTEEDQSDLDGSTKED